MGLDFHGGSDSWGSRWEVVGWGSGWGWVAMVLMMLGVAQVGGYRVGVVGRVGLPWG